MLSCVGYRVVLMSMVAALLLLVTGQASFADFRSYHIGNSLTVDAGYYHFPNDYVQKGVVWDYGNHIRSAQPLVTIIENEPGIYNTSSVSAPNTPYGPWQDALQNYEFDAITFQPHVAHWSNFATDFSSVITAVQYYRTYHPTADTKMYIYATWPKLSALGSKNFSEYWWREDWAIDNTWGNVAVQEYYEVLVDELRLAPELQGEEIGIVYAGDAIARIEDDIHNGQFPTNLAALGYTDPLASANDMYRDDTHLNDFGRMVARSAMLATMNGESAVGIDLDAAYDQELEDYIHGVTWESVQANSSYTLIPEPTSAIIMMGFISSFVLRRNCRK